VLVFVLFFDEILFGETEQVPNQAECSQSRRNFVLLKGYKDYPTQNFDRIRLNTIGIPDRKVERISDGKSDRISFSINFPIGFPVGFWSTFRSEILSEFRARWASLQIIFILNQVTGYYVANLKKESESYFWKEKA